MLYGTVTKVDKKTKVVEGTYQFTKEHNDKSEVFTFKTSLNLHPTLSKKGVKFTSFLLPDQNAPTRVMDSNQTYHVHLIDVVVV